MKLHAFFGLLHHERGFLRVQTGRQSPHINPHCSMQTGLSHPLFTPRKEASQPMSRHSLCFLLSPISHPPGVGNGGEVAGATVVEMSSVLR